MEMFQLTRKEMAELLVALTNEDKSTPLGILKKTWFRRHPHLSEQEASNVFMSSQLPEVFEKFIKAGKKNIVLTINEIVALGNQIEHTTFQLTTVQNWVKRDIKDIIGSPEHGKRYSIDQATMLFMVDDLRTFMDLASIRQVLKMLFNDPETREDDLIRPLDLYLEYSSIFEDLNPQKSSEMSNDKRSGFLFQKEKSLENLIESRAEKFVERLTELTSEQKNIVKNAIVIKTLTIQMSYLQSIARRYSNTMLFLLNE